MKKLYIVLAAAVMSVGLLEASDGGSAAEKARREVREEQRRRHAAAWNELPSAQPMLSSTLSSSLPATGSTHDTPVSPESLASSVIQCGQPPRRSPQQEAQVELTPTSQELAEYLVEAKQREEERCVALAALKKEVFNNETTDLTGRELKELLLDFIKRLDDVDHVLLKKRKSELVAFVALVEALFDVKRR